MDDEIVARAQARIGTVLRGKYRLDAVIGAGGMAVVYAVTHRNQKRFALKMLHPELSLRSDLKQRFLREGYAANSLGHPGAVAVLDDDVAEDGAAFLVMELLDGAPVQRVWEARGRRLPPDAVLALAHQLLDTLAAAHAKSIVHRDIKPDNLFLSTDGGIKVLDFGIARVKDGVSGGAGTTSTGAVLGTPAFMAPEQALGRSSEIDGLTDVWAVGATLFTLLSGEHVHPAESAPHMLVQAATVQARSLAAVCPDVSAPITALVDRALVFARAGRWPSAAAMRDATASAWEALVGGAVSRAPLVLAMQEHAKHSAVLRQATAATVASGDHGAAEATAPTVSVESLSGPSIPGTPVSAPARSVDDLPVGATGNVVSPVAMTLGRPAGRRWGRVVLPLAGAAVVAGGFAGFLRLRSHSMPPVAAAAAVAPAPVSAEPTSQAAPAEPAPKVVEVEVSPATATVEVDGQRVPLAGGFAEVRGVPGSMHLVHVMAGKRDATYPVLLTEAGPVPARVELAVAPAASPRSAAPAPKPRAAPSPPQPSARDAVSRTMQ